MKDVKDWKARDIRAIYHNGAHQNIDKIKELAKDVLEDEVYEKVLNPHIAMIKEALKFVEGYVNRKADDDAVNN